MEKCVYISSSREEDVSQPVILEKRYAEYFDEHMAEYKKVFELADIAIEGDELADSGVRFANYHSIISASRNDSVHSIAGLGLTG